MRNEHNVKEKLPVIFVKAQNTKLLRRVTPTRQMMQSSKLLRDQFQKQTIIRPSYASSEVFYVIPSMPEQTFPIYGNAKREGLEMPSMTRSLHIPKQSIIKTNTIELKEKDTSETKMQPAIVGGFNFLKEIAPIQALPSLTDSLQSYIQTVRTKIEFQKRYPLSARKAMLEGRVGLVIIILENGQLENAKIIESSGHNVLDIAALECIRSSAPFPPLPKDMKRKSIQMSIYLTFKMM